MWKRVCFSKKLSESQIPSWPFASNDRYICSLHSFTQRADVRKHKKTVHEKARDFRCEECNLSFGEVCELNKLIISIYLVLKPKLTNLNSKQRGNLNKHVRSIHRKERNFLCEQCGAAFPFRNGLTEHIRMRHTDERPYACDRCTSSFKKKSHLHRHISVVHKDLTMMSNSASSLGNSRRTW